MEGSTKPAPPEDIQRLGPRTATGATESDVPESVEKAAKSERDAKQMSDGEHLDALDWLLSDEADDPVEVSTSDLRINVGTPNTPRWVDWTIRNVDRDTLKTIQRSQQGATRAQRRGFAPVDVDADAASLRIIVRGTVKPDLREAAERKGVQAAPDPDYAPMQVVAHRFRNKPGLLDQLVGEIFDLSGYDEGAIQRAEEKEVSAAGN